MKAVLLTAYGDVDKLVVREVPDPKAGPNEIRIRLAAASINPVDWKQRSGLVAQRMPLDLPAILGRDASGEVIEVGAGVTAFQVGDKVLGRVMGSYAEQVVAPVDAWAKLPAKLELVDAAALPLVVLTGAQLAEEAVNPKPGDLVLVTGALGGVGRTAIFAAKARGAKVYAGVRAKQRAEAATLGADVVVALDDAGDVDKLPPLDGIADTIGGETIQKLLGKLKAGGAIGSVVGEPAGAKERGFVVRAIMTRSDPKRLGELAQAVADGKLSIPIARRFPLTQAAEAQKVAEAHVGGKVLLLA
jgi:NADPH:quinone reductase-like Zn-dependent oxidoreductase